MQFFGKVTKIVVEVLLFLAALAEISSYLETSAKWSGVVQMLSSFVSPETLSLAYSLLFLLAAAIGLWWFDRRLQGIEDRLHKLEGGKEPYVSVKPGEIIHPSPDGVLWKWNAEIGADGPFCPRHRERLFHRNWLGHTETENFEDGFLNETFWFTCPADEEDFKLPVRHTSRVRELRAQAAARLRSNR